MKKLNIAIVVVLLFVLTTYTCLYQFAQSKLINVTASEYKIGEYKVNESEAVKAEYYEEPVVEQYIPTQYSTRNNNVSVPSTSSNNYVAPAPSLGDIGRLSIPAVGYTAALYNGLPRGSAGAQQIVNAVDSACYVNYGFGTTYIGDHNYQGFENMKSSVPGVTRAYITWTDGSTSSYVCMSVQYNCVKNGAYIYDEGGNSIYSSGYSIAMVTCNYNSSTVTVSYWNRE